MSKIQKPRNHFTHIIHFIAGSFYNKRPHAAVSVFDDFNGIYHLLSIAAVAEGEDFELARVEAAGDLWATIFIGYAERGAPVVCVEGTGVGL
jgi:hypothetical protein